jgi:hypothetical protein
MKQIKYIASKTSAKFHNSKKVVRGLLGPVGNGKTVACVNEMHRLAVLQEPNSEGIRKTRWAIIRNTYPELRTTTLNTFKQWIPDAICPIVLSPIIMGTMKYKLPDSTMVEAEFLFLALDRDEDVKKLLSLELTGAFCNETRELPYAVIKGCRERIGRYPARVDGYEDTEDYKAPEHPCTRKALIMDTNPPDDDHWWYQLAEEGSLRSNKTKQAKEAVSKIFDFFHAPSPLIKTETGYIENPEAENIANLPGGYQYYFDMIAGNTEDHINVMVMGNYGMIKEGRPVYTNYNDLTHCPQKPLSIIEDLPIGLGWDFGLTPSVIFGQLTDTGQMRVFAELVTEDMDVRTFARDVVKPFIQKNFYGMEIDFSYADPAGNNRGEGEGKSAIKILNDDYAGEQEDGSYIAPLNMGFMTEAAPTNDPTQRIDAVSSVMGRMVNGEPAYQLSKACKMLRKGKNGGYRYKKINAPGSEIRFQEKPDKNRYSHPSDAEQYLALGYVGGYVKESYNDDVYDDFHDEPGAMGY